MPTFQGALNNKDVDAIIAFIKSLSSDSLGAAREEINEHHTGK
jgi:hypothetical protein